MATLTITIQDAQVGELLDAIAYFHPIPQTIPGVPDYTKPGWARRHIKRYLNTILNRYKNVIAKQAVNVPYDDTHIDVA